MASSEFNSGSVYSLLVCGIITNDTEKVRNDNFLKNIMTNNVNDIIADQAIVDDDEDPFVDVLNELEQGGQ